MHSRLERSVFVGATFGAALMLASAGSAAAPDLVRAGQLHCTVDMASEQAVVRQSWQIELDETVPLAMVDDGDLPADYSPSHVRIRFAIKGPVLTIGRVSGRIVVTDVDGKPLGRGRCAPQIVAGRAGSRAG